MHKRWFYLFLFNFILTTTALANPQLRPKIMIIFDTSGSMLQSSAYDGSSLCNGTGTSSRIYQLKQALFETLQGIGATEIDFALATFPQYTDPTAKPYCPLGHYYTDSDQSSEVSGWESRSGCKVSTHNPLTQTSGNCGDSSNPCSAWYDDYKNEVLKVPFGKSPDQVMIYFDHLEDTDSIAPLENPEIRAFSWTPLGKSLFYAYGYLHKEVALPQSSYLKKCERLVVALFTDGLETCNKSSDNYYPTKWSANLHAAPMSATVHTVAIDINNTLLTTIATTGGGTPYNVKGDSNSLKKAFLDIIAKSQTPQELCNGEDDDCDNLVDEDFPQKGDACNNGKLGICYATGVYICKTDGSGVECDAQGQSPTTEICNGLDDDCNGVVDDAVGGCQPCVPQPEICNGQDDDCNGLVDDGLNSAPCGTDLGECKPGVSKCVNGKLICEGAIAPQEEICDNKDNDCDGVIDGVVEQCYDFDSGCDKTTFICNGFCAAGTRVCTAGNWGTCLGQVGPETEICDGLDNDCDGDTDEQAECPGTSMCIEGQCTRECAGDEFACPPGQFCKEGYCVIDRCDKKQCYEAGGVCKLGECIDLCEGVTCDKYEECQRGVCVDVSCYSQGCPSGETCIQGECKPDPCANVNCTNDEFCKEGQCLTLCEVLKCEKGQSCQVVENNGAYETQCIDDDCVGVHCNDLERCVDGKCEDDPCAKVSCEKGQLCEKGVCINDVCETISCPISYICEDGLCVSGATSTEKILVSGRGGFSCHLSRDGQSTPWTFFFLLLGLVTLNLRRKR